MKSPVSYSVDFLCAAALLAVALLFGGGGSPAPMTELVVQIAACLLFLVALWTGKETILPGRAIIWLCVLPLALPFVQLIPLPPSIWQLPGRGTERALNEVLGTRDIWHPLTYSVSSTLAAAFSLLPGIFMLILSARLNLKEREQLVLFFLILALISALLGMLQVIFPSSQTLRFYAFSHPRVVIGTFANRNHMADLMLIGLIAAGTLLGLARARGKSRNIQAGLFLAIALLTLALIATASRTGVALVIPTLCASLFYWAIQWQSRPAGQKRISDQGTYKKLKPFLITALLLSLVAGAITELSNSIIFERTFGRFENLDDIRPQLWKDTGSAISQTFPAGTGMGTFVPVFQQYERLEIVVRSFANRAHNDYLELALEAGILPLLLFSTLIIWMVSRLASILRQEKRRSMRALFLLSLTGIIIFALHSLVDYPLRTLSLMCVAGMLLGLMTPEGSRSRQPD